MNIKETNTTRFLVPGLGFNVEAIREAQGFMNGYLHDKGYFGHFEMPVFMLFKPADLDAFQAFITAEYQGTRTLLDDYDYQDGFVVLVYRFAERFWPEYKLFLKGRYSKFRKSYIAMLPSLINTKVASGEIVQELSIPYMVCNKSAQMKTFLEDYFTVPGHQVQNMDDAEEYWMKPKLEAETLDIDKIRQRLVNL